MEVEPLLNSGVHRERVRQELGYRPGDVVIGKIARLFHLKGHADVIRAARQVIEQQPNVRFLFVGDGILRPELERQIAAAGLQEHFQLLGLVPPERIPELLAAMDILVHASLREGLAKALPQALIAGKPVVSYDIDGAREVVISDVTGYLVPPPAVGQVANLNCSRHTPCAAADGTRSVPATLVEAMTRLAADAALLERLGTEGRRRFTDQFRHERMTAQIRALYESTLEKNRATAPPRAS
jgi:glycosyltransferase involved in cell wall biosynthesis